MILLARAQSLTPRALRLAGCVFAVASLAAFGGVGCDRVEGPRVWIENASGRRLEGFWVRTDGDSVRVPAIDPGRSVEVHPRVRGEARLSVVGRFAGRRVESVGGDYVEGSAGYRFRAVVDSAGGVTVRFLGLSLR